MTAGKEDGLTAAPPPSRDNGPITQIMRIDADNQSAFEHTHRRTRAWRSQHGEAM